ncbi:hypothetical protein GCM10023149_38790 [Mucilaginibacter gynuensis]|uniref:DUF559 domain-containing protein n=2 Tax=Mucilaginibacter gynuensis TaxID=1302236 RepID=A0ABP8H053_9SPHI
MLVIEVDGHSHNNEITFNHDEHRQSKLESYGITVLRFNEAEVKHDRLNVTRTITYTIIELIKKTPGCKLPSEFDMTLLDG